MISYRSETLARNAFEQAPIGISYANSSGQLLHANGAFCSFLGFDPQDVVSMYTTQLTHPDDLAHNAEELRRLWRGDIEVIDVEKRYIRSDRRSVWVRATTALVRDESEAPTCAVEFLRDISARKDLAAALLENQRLLQAVISDVPVAIRACDRNGRVFLHNSAAARLFALGSADNHDNEALNLSAVDVFLPDKKTAVPSEERPLARALRGDVVTNMELLIARRGQSASARTTLNSARRLTTNTGECLGAVVITQDITEKKSLELELANAQKLESIGQLAAGIAHEINTPTQFIGDNLRFLHESVGDILRVIEGVLELAASEGECMTSAKSVTALLRSIDIDYFCQEVPKALTQSLDGVARISAIVAAMKEFSHPATEKAPHDLNRAILSTITVATNEWKYVADIKTDLASDLPLTPAMPGAFNQVILNILVNAAHAIGESMAEAAGTKGLITIATRRLTDWAEIRIQDSGCGMPEEIRRRIFDPFFTTKPVGKGTGQGLAIAYDVIVNKHQGSITVESVPGSGTTFVLRLPLNASSPDSAAAA